MKLLVKILIYFISIVVATYLLSGVVVDSAELAILVAVVFLLLNVTIKPLIKLVTLPINILTLGVFSLIINGFIVMVANWLVPGFTVDSFLTALLFGLIMSVVVFVLEKFD